MITLVLGGVRSGKSRFAEQLAKTSDLDVTYIATAMAPPPPGDNRYQNSAHGNSNHADSNHSNSNHRDSNHSDSNHGDDEMRRRIEAHRARRPKTWALEEEPFELAKALSRWESPERYVLVDCLTLWLTNLLCDPEEEQFTTQREALIAHLQTRRSPTTLVSNETNMGIVPLGALSRRYCDEAGRLHQDIAGLSDRVILMVAGLPTVLKGPQL